MIRYVSLHCHYSSQRIISRAGNGHCTCPQLSDKIQRLAGVKIGVRSRSGRPCCYPGCETWEYGKLWEELGNSWENLGKSWENTWER